MPQSERQPSPPDETVHDEHPVEPAEGAREPGEQTQSPDLREHSEEPAEGPR